MNNNVIKFIQACGILLAGFVALGGISDDLGAKEGAQVTRTTRVPGTRLPVFVKEVSLDTEEFTVTFSVVNATEYLFHLVLPKNSESGRIGGASLERMHQDSASVAIFPGGFLETFTPPIPAGLVQHNRKLLNDAKGQDPVLDGVLCLGPAKGGGTVVDVLKLDAATLTRTRYSDCLQAGPLLVDGGKPYADLDAINRHKESRHFAGRSVERSFLAKASRNRIIIGISSPTSLAALRALILLPERNGGLGATHAIGLSGRTTAGFIVARPQPLPRFSAGLTEVPLPNAVAISEE